MSLVALLPVLIQPQAAHATGGGTMVVSNQNRARPHQARSKERAASYRARAKASTRAFLDSIRKHFARIDHKIQLRLRNWPRTLNLYRLLKHPKRTAAQNLAIQEHGTHRAIPLMQEGFRFMRPTSALRKLVREGDGAMGLIAADNHVGEEMAWVIKHQRGRFAAIPATLARKGYSSNNIEVQMRPDEIEEWDLSEINRRLSFGLDKTVTGFQSLPHSEAPIVTEP
jgi:hypothetical protein